MMRLLLVEDHAPVRRALREGLEATSEAQVVAEAATAREAIGLAEANGEIEVALMDVELRDADVGAEAASGVGAAVAIRRERPRFPVVFYSIQDDDTYFREFRASGILSHYAYVRKSNYLLPSMLTPLLRDAIAGRSFIDPEIEDRVDEVRERDATSPRALLEPNEQAVARMLAQGMTNEQIAARMGFRDNLRVSTVANTGNGTFSNQLMEFWSSGRARRKAHDDGRRRRGYPTGTCCGGRISNLAD